MAVSDGNSKAASPKKKAGGKAADKGAAGKKGKKKGSPDKGSPGDKAPQCSEEIKRLQAELSLVQAALAAQHAAAHAREEELAAVRLQHAQDAAAAADVQASQRHEAEQLRAAARGLEDQLGAARQEAAALQRALQAELDSAAEAGAADAGGAGQPSSELQRALSHHRRQEERLAAQAQEMEGLRARLRRAEDSLAASVSTAAALQVRVASRSELRFVRGAPWLVHVGRERLTGPAPAAAQPGGTLAAVGRRLVLEGPSSGDAGDQPGQLQLHSLDLGSGAWAATPASGPAVEGRAVCSVGGKLLGVGSSCGGELLAGAAFAQFMAPDLQQWLPAPPPAGPPGAQPPPRRDAALAFCPRAGAAFLFGGTGEKGTTLGDLWHFDLARSTWSRLDTAASGRAAAQEPGCTHTAPPPCSGAALAVSPDGGRLWLMGGRLEGGRCSRALHWFDLPQRYWAAVDAQGADLVEPRTQHAMACVGRYLVVVGGLTHAACGQAARAQDCCLYDTAAGCWDLLDSCAFEPAAAGPSSEAGAAVSMAGWRSSSCGGQRSSKAGREAPAAFLGAASAAFVGSNLLLLKAVPGSGLSELWSVDLQPPEAIERQAAAKQAATAVVQRLALTCEDVTATSVRLSWRAPSANHNKLLSFKLMAANAEGRAREAYEGPDTSCSVAGLTPGSQFVFCLKALFDDATSLWSEPILVTTAKRQAGK